MTIENETELKFPDPDAPETVESLADSIAAAVEASNEEGRATIDVTSKRRKSRTTYESETPKLVYTGEELVPGFQAIGAMIAARYGTAPMSEQEARELANGWAPVLTKYMGASIEAYGPEIAALLITAKIGLPRYASYVAAQKLEKAEEVEAEVVPNKRDDFKVEHNPDIPRPRFP